jgi:hypothetical protein
VVAWRRTLAKEHHLERLGSAHLSLAVPTEVPVVSPRGCSAEVPSQPVRTSPLCSACSGVASSACVLSGDTGDVALSQRIFEARGAAALC